MKIWEEWRAVVLGAVAGSIVTMLLGFLVFGWVPGSTSATSGNVQSAASVVTALTVVCAAQFRADPNAAQNLEKLKETSSFEQGPYIEKGGWATMPGADAPVTGVAKGCANALIAP